MVKAIILGILSALFFATTFLLNRSMSLDGSSFAWSASLRFLFMLPPLLLLSVWRGTIREVGQELKHHFKVWFVWGTVGFGFFYTAICFAGDYGPSWLIAGTWQLTIICGPLLAPLFKEKIPWASLRWSILILLGILLIQWDQATSVSLPSVLLSVLPILLAAISYPLGNRMVIAHSGGKLDTFTRILLMCIGSLPWWLLMAGIGYGQVGLPSSSQMLQSLIIAVCSGLIATSLFFYATTLASWDQHRLAIVEATQATEVLFTVIGEVFLLSSAYPSALALTGLFIVCAGIILQCIYQTAPSKKEMSLSQ